VFSTRDRRAAILVDSSASTMIERGDVLVVFGRKEDIEGMLQAEE
jgi:Trk K+ transport system NAD-binding subunit